MDQLALDVVTFCQTVKCLAGQIFLRDLALKFDAWRAEQEKFALGHGALSLSII